MTGTIIIDDDPVFFALSYKKLFKLKVSLMQNRLILQVAAY
jgi:hypothetical protein